LQLLPGGRVFIGMCQWCVLAVEVTVAAVLVVEVVM
jgi:hypothetical protein